MTTPVRARTARGANAADRHDARKHRTHSTHAPSRRPAATGTPRPDGSRATAHGYGPGSTHRLPHQCLAGPGTPAAGRRSCSTPSVAPVELFGAPPPHTPGTTTPPRPGPVPMPGSDPNAAGAPTGRAPQRSISSSSSCDDPDQRVSLPTLDTAGPPAPPPDEPALAPRPARPELPPSFSNRLIHRASPAVPASLPPDPDLPAPSPDTATPTPPPDE